MAIDLNTLFTSLGIISGNTQSKNQYEFYNGIVWDDATITYNQKEFFDKVGLSRYDFFKQYGNEKQFYEDVSDSNISDFRTFYEYAGAYLVTAASPSVAFTGSPLDTTLNQIITFTNTTSGTTPITYLWDFGDGATSSAANPTHSYSATGSYTIALTASNSEGSDSLIRTDYITINLDTDALDYIARVESADGESLEDAVKITISDFFVGLKSDGIFDEISSSCILAGARTIEGAIEPLKLGGPTISYEVGGSGPSFTASVYDRKTGLKGTGAGSSNGAYIKIATPTFTSNDTHMCIYESVPRTVSTATTAGYFGHSTTTNGYYQAYGGASFGVRNQTSTADAYASTDTTTFNGFIGVSRNSSTEYKFRVNVSGTPTTYTTTRASNPTIPTDDFYIFRRHDSVYIDNRISFFSVGNYINIEDLESRVVTLMSGLSASIA